jgi:hypothetical protein
MARADAKGVGRTCVRCDVTFSSKAATAFRASHRADRLIFRRGSGEAATCFEVTHVAGIELLSRHAAVSISCRPLQATNLPYDIVIALGTAPRSAQHAAGASQT